MIVQSPPEWMNPMAHASLLVGLALYAGLSAGTPPDPLTSKREGITIEPALIQETVEALGTALSREYFDTTVADKVSEALQKRHKEGQYQKVPSIVALAKALTEDLYAMTKDKHLVVSPVVDLPPGPTTTIATDDTRRDVVARRSNFGIQRVEILPGNVGYLNLTAFYRAGEARGAIASAMASLRHADAFILDLRDNGGGSTGTVALMASYFFETQGLPLFEVVPRPPEKATSFTTETEMLPDRNQQRPTYVLTSGNTWSGGEGLAFILQERHRAEVVGKMTAGAGNQARTHRLNARFEVTIPNGCVRTAIHNQSWEGTGVVPDIPTASSDALRVAHVLALRKLMRTFPSGPWHDALEKHLGELGEQRK